MISRNLDHAVALLAHRAGRERAMRLLATGTALGPLLLLCGACGGARRHASPPSSSPSGSAQSAATTSKTTSPEPLAYPLSNQAVARYLTDFDTGPSVRGGRDKEDNEIMERFGHLTTVREARAIVRAVKRYYAVARTGDGRKACSMLVPAIAKATPTTWGRNGSPPYAIDAKTCAETVTFLFKRLHHRFSGSIAAMNVVVNGDHAYVLVGSTTAPAGFVTLERWHGAWTMTEPVNGDMY
jgi:hypothetical protein